MVVTVVAGGRGSVGIGRRRSKNTFGIEIQSGVWQVLVKGGDAVVGVVNAIVIVDVKEVTTIFE